MIFNAFKDKMPALPAFKADYRVIRLEPISMSGELLTIGVMAQSGNEVRVVSALSPRQLKCMYGSSYKNINGIISLVLNSARHHLKAGHHISAWSAPIEGVTTDEVVSTRSNSGIKGVLFQALTSSSSMHSGDIVKDAMSEIADEDQEVDGDAVRLVSSVKAMLGSGYKDRFSKQVDLLKGTTITVDYLGVNYNADIANFDIKSAKAALVNTKAKLLDFDIFRNERARQGINDNQKFELLVSANKSRGSEHEDNVNQVKQFAESIDIPMFIFLAPQEIASRIKESDPV